MYFSSLYQLNAISVFQYKALALFGSIFRTRLWLRCIIVVGLLLSSCLCVTREYTYTFAWSKIGESLPLNAADDAKGTLTISNVRPSDAGRYSCTGSNIFAVDTDEAVLHVKASSNPPRDAPPTVRVEPRYRDVSVGDSVEFECLVTGIPEPTLEWLGGRNGLVNPQASFSQGIFRITRAKKTDEAEYKCIATNRAGRAEATAIVYVRGEDAGDVEFKVLVDQPQLTLTPGQEARLGCNAETVVPIDRIDWTRMSAPLPSGAYQEGSTLIIPDCQPTASGRYVCTITLVNGEVSQAIATLTIAPEDISASVRPAAVIDPVTQTVSQGNTATLTCVVTGQPRPTITWSKVGEAFGPNHRVLDNVLRIQQATPHDRGLYLCVAENLAGRAQASAIVEVERREAPMVELYPAAMTTLPLGASALFQCRVMQGIPSPTITWYRANNEPLTSNTEIFEQNGVIRFNRVTGPEQGSYVCQASNEVGTVTATASVIIKGPPKVTVKPSTSELVVRAGQSVNMECTATGEPLPAVVWIAPRRGMAGVQPSEVGSALYRVRFATITDSGLYICQATNEYGRSESRLQLTVEGTGDRIPPNTDGDPSPLRARVEPEVAVVSEGDQVELRCETVGDQSATIQWERVEGALPPQHRVQKGKLQVSQVTEADAGTYRCVVSGETGVAEAMAQLRVLVRPVVRVSPASVSLRAGEQLTLTCSGVGTPPVQTEWHRRNGALSVAATQDGSGRLTIPTVTAADTGVYLCVATNGAGQTQGTAQVAVIVPPSVVVRPSTVDARQGDLVQLQCEVTGVPSPRVTWTFNNGRLPLQAVQEDNNLIVYSIQAEDSGLYMCTASNDAGTISAHSTVTVPKGEDIVANIPDEVQLVVEGDRVEVTCKVRGEPLITWERLDEPMPSYVVIQDNALIFHGVRQQDSGKYRCTAMYESGTAAAQVTILVEEPPHIATQRQERSVAEASQVTLHCQATGNPEPTITWSRNTGLLPREHSVSNGDLTIFNIKREDSGEYICTATNSHGSASGFITLQVGDTVMYFTQTPVSYVVLPTLNDVYVEFDIDISFRPEATDGVIFYNGENAEGPGDFISFAMSNGRAELRFDLGAGPAIITSRALSFDTWYTARIRRKEKEGVLILDNQQYTGTAPGTFRGLSLKQPFYLGGVPPTAAISPAAASQTTGFIGCISRMAMNGVEMKLAADAVEMKGIENCPVCQGRPCQNGGSCQAAMTREGYRCSCRTGYSGNNCQLIGERCALTSCTSAAQCVNLPDGLGYKCVCPVGQTGANCREGLVISDPAFSGSSYITLPTLPDSLVDTLLELRIKPTSLRDGIILYNANNLSGVGDYIALLLKDQKIHLLFDSGSGPGSVESIHTLQADEWVSVVAKRKQKRGSLIINGGLEATGTSPGDTVGLNLKAALFIGGVSSAVRVAPAVGIYTGFEGCITNLAVKSRSVSLLKDAIDWMEITNCGVDSQCTKKPCQNGATCSDISSEEFQCQCPSAWTGALCENEVTICTTSNPCLNGALCEAYNSGQVYNCRCPLGYSGKNCQDKISIGKEAYLRGDGYIELPKAFLPHTNPRDEELLELTITTTRPNGLIFWHGQQPSVPGAGKDYMALGLSNGYVVFSFELGSGPANITSSQRVNDGQRHIITVSRMGRFGSVEVDEKSYNDGESKGSLENLNTEGNIFIGGTPNTSYMTNGVYIENFIGCIQDLYVEGTGVLDFDYDTLGGYGVQTCADN